MSIIPFIDVSHTGYNVHLMVMSRDVDVANAGTTWRKVSVTLTIPVTDVCYAFGTDVCYAHRKCSSCLAWMIVMLDMDNPSFSVAHVMLLRGATCASRGLQYPACHDISWCNLCILTFKRGSLDDTLWTQHHD